MAQSLYPCPVFGVHYNPRLKVNPSAQELDEIYTPNIFELVFAEERTRQPTPRVGLLLLLKTFQRLGYFVRYTEIPAPIVAHIVRCRCQYGPGSALGYRAMVFTLEGMTEAKREFIEWLFGECAQESVSPQAILDRLEITGSISTGAHRCRTSRLT